MIAPLAKQHVEAVARLHRASLTGLLSDLGLPAVNAFYAGCVASDLVIGFVYLEDGAVRGFVLGSVHSAKLRAEALRKNPVGTLWGLGVGILRRPSSLVSLVRSFRKSDRGDYDRTAAELIYLAVSAESRGIGMGARLVGAFTEQMRDAGVGAYELSVDEDNKSAAAFYERLGFVLSGRYREFGLQYRRYRRESTR